MAIATSLVLVVGLISILSLFHPNIPSNPHVLSVVQPLYSGLVRSICCSSLADCPLIGQGDVISIRLCTCNKNRNLDEGILSFEHGLRNHASFETPPFR
jgi:hypothetical protein